MLWKHNWMLALDVYGGSMAIHHVIMDEYFAYI